MQPRTTLRQLIRTGVFLGLALWVFGTIDSAIAQESIIVNCNDPAQTLSQAVATTNPGDIILVTGTCTEIITITDSNEQNPGQKSDLLSQIDHEIDRFVADGIYDQQPVYTAVEAHSPSASVIIPPRKNAALSPTAKTSPTQRDKHLATIERDGMFAWKRTSGVDAQFHAENAFARFKRAFGGGLRAKWDASQERETMIACQLLIRMWELRRPRSYPIR